jgi:competence protein ComEC
MLKRFLTYLAASATTTLVATIATTPISISSFNRFSFQAILGNVVSIPIITFLIAPLGILSFVTAKFTSLFIFCFEKSIDVLIYTAKFVSSLPGSEIPLRTPHVSFLWFTLLGGIILCFFQSKIRYVSIIPIAIAIIDYALINRSPNIILIPKEDLVFVAKDNTIYTNSTKRGKSKARTIQKILGFNGDILGLPSKEENIIKKISLNNINKECNYFIWTNGEKIKKIKKMNNFKGHPFCPVFYSKSDVSV